MPIDPKSIQWDPVDASQVQWDGGAPAADPLTKAEKFKRGLRDPLDGGAQLLTKLLPAGVVSAGNQLNNWLADKTGLVGRLPEGGVDQQVRESEAQYQQRRQAGGESGIDGWRLTGNVANPINLAAASRIPAAATLAGKAATGAIGGWLSALLQPVTQGDDYALEKAKQVATGAAFGGAVPVAAAGVGRAISPLASRADDLRKLASEGVRTTVGQTLGGAFNKAEQRAMSLPLIGDSIAAARRRSMEDLNTAVANRALQPIGAKLPDGLTGREAVEFTQKALSDKYEQLLPQMTTQADKQFVQQLQDLGKMVATGSIDPRAANSFKKILQNDVLSKFKGQNAITGQTLKEIEGDLGAQASRFSQSTDADQRLLADALREAQSSLRELAARSNPKLANELGAVNAGWANFKRLERAASSVAAEDGMFSPAQLQSAVKALDRSKDKAKFARGEALMQDLSDVAKSRLGANVPDSGTAGRMLWPAAAVAGLADPKLAVGLAGGGLLYSSPAQALMRGLLTNRGSGKAAEQVAGLLTQSSPMLAPAGGLLALDVLK